jgi:UDP:flavonoid glycosyltransferase YjiC (YdhE family)
MRVLLSTYGSRGAAEPMVGLAVQLRALGAEMPPRAAGWVAARFDTVAAAAEEGDAPVANGVMPTGVWR